MQFVVLQVHPEEIIEETAKLSNGDAKTPAPTARLDTADDMGSSSSLGTVQPQPSSRGHERADSSESLYRYLHATVFESSLARNETN